MVVGWARGDGEPKHRQASRRCRVQRGCAHADGARGFFSFLMFLSFLAETFVAFLAIFFFGVAFLAAFLG